MTVLKAVSNSLVAPIARAGVVAPPFQASQAVGLVVLLENFRAPFLGGIPAVDLRRIHGSFLGETLLTAFFGAFAVLG